MTDFEKGGKKNECNFENMRIDFGEVVALDKGDDAEAVRAETYARVKKEVAGIIRTTREKRGIK